MQATGMQQSTHEYTIDAIMQNTREAQELIRNVTYLLIMGGCQTVEALAVFLKSREFVSNESPLIIINSEERSKSS